MTTGMMKRPFVVLGGLLLALSAMTWSEARGAALTLAQDGKSDYVIALAQDAIPSEKTAAEQLQKYLNQVTGASFAVKPENEVAADAPQILVGAGNRVKTLLAKQDWAALGQDGIVIKTVGNRLILAGGRPRGTLYAVFQFLEDDVGCRWWTPDAITIPHRPTLSASVKDVTYRPVFDYRGDYSNITNRNPEYAAILRENGDYQKQSADWGGHYQILGFVHTFCELLPPKKYFKDHPEWFTDGNNGFLPCTAQSKMPGPNDCQLDLSNPQVLDELTKQALIWIKENPQAGYISISQNDSVSYCRCAECTKVAEEQGSQSGPILKFVNEVAARIHKQYPNFMVETLAYTYSIKPPKTIRPGKNVIIRIAPIHADFGHPMDSDWNKEDRDNILAWAKIAPQLFIWNYTTNFKYPMFPNPNWAGLAKDLRFYAAHHVTGIFAEADSVTNGVGDFTQLRAWLLGKLMWDPNLDQDKLIDEFLNGYYGAAGPYLGQYLDLIEQSFLSEKRKLTAYNDNFSFFTLDVTNRAIALFDEAAQAVKDDPALSARVRRTRLSLDAAVMYRAKFLERKAQQTGKTFNGPTDLTAALESFKKTAHEFHVERFDHDTPFDKGVERLAAVLTRPEVPLPEFAQKYPAEDVIDLHPVSMLLYRPGILTGVVDDPAASAGKAAMMVGDSVDWLIQAHLGPYIQSPNHKWHIYVYARLDAAAGAKPDGACASGGIYSDAEKAASGRFALDAAEANGTTYHRFDLGVHKLNGGMFLWFNPLNKPSIKKVYFDRIILIREPGS
jgi:hypothetical protein